MIGTVAGASLRLWRREMAVLFRTSERRVSHLLAVGALTALLFGVILALTSTSQLDKSLPVELRTTLVTTSLGGALLTSSLVATIVFVSAPPGTALQTLLDLLPVSRTAAQVGQHLPLAGCAFLFSLSLSAVSLVVGLRISPSPMWSVVFTAAVLLVVVCACLTAFAGLGALRALFARCLRMSDQYAMSLAGILVVAITVGTVVPDVFRFEPDEGTRGAGILFIHRALAALLADPSAWDLYLIVFAWLLVTAAGVRSLAWSAARRSPAPPMRIFIGVAVPFHPFRGPLWAFLLASIRSPQGVMTVLGASSLVMTAWLVAREPLLAPLAPTIAASAATIPFLLVIFAIGRALPLRWWGTQLTGRRSWWITPIVVGHFLLGWAVALPILGLEIVLQLIEPDDVVEVIAKLVFAFVAALVAGSVVPYSEQQPLSATLSGCVVALLFTGNAVASALTMSSLGLSAPLIVPAVGALLLIGAIIPLVGVLAKHDGTIT